MVSPMSRPSPPAIWAKGAYTSNSQIEMNASTAPNFMRPAKGARDNRDGDNGERSLESDVNGRRVRVVGKRQIAAAPACYRAAPRRKSGQTAEERTAAVAAVGRRPASLIHNTPTKETDSRRLT